ncbi:hypothetical protein [Bradyrhizobium prioriisuperbiae]|uniref:hypothetical protein n=1 Tax=Bradyrhizobium prioriisuperbiae TaxID=2854389 RepID=UPI0028EDD41D|nr:hypothetical protein [Bradyrhizobium prioritasuperba]
MIRKLARYVVIVGLSALGAQAAFAVSTNPMDIDLSDDAPISGLPVSPRIDAADPAPAVPSMVMPRPSALAPAPQRPLSANPLWSLPLAQLPVTRERPIFSPSRRPPPTAVAADLVAEAPRPPPPPREPERPDLELVGTIASGDEGFGIFLDQSTKTPLRLKVGEDYQGWKLRSVRGREATLVRDQQAAVMTLPQPDGTGEGEVHLMPVSAVRPLSSQQSAAPAR